MTTQYTADALGYYQILGVPFDADENLIKQNYRERAKMWHPDHNAGPEATEKFQKLSVAYDILKEADSRLFYDLLTQIYTAKDFPDMFALKAYSDRAGQENPYLRVFSLRRVVGKIVKTSDEEHDEICNAKEATGIVFQTSLKNWLLGWWGWPAFVRNIQAIKANFSGINQNRQKNLTLLVHNALAYAQENKKDKALASAVQALNYANPYQQGLIRKLIYFLGENPDISLPKFNFAMLKYIQLIVPGIILLGALVPTTAKFVSESELLSYFSANKEIIYNQEVRFNDGRETFDDMMVSKILNIPADTSSLNNLYHLKNAARIMYGPSDDFDVITELRGQTTVRLTGKTPDDVWARIMLDNGEMGFVRLNNLSKGISKEIPADSKIYTGPRPIAE